MTTAVIVDAIRTPLGKRNGKLKDWHPVDLAAETLKALVDRTGIDPGLVDDVVMGCVMQVGEQGVNIARNAVLAAGWPEDVPGTTVDRQCGSSQQAAHFAAQGVIAGAYDVVVAAGVEVMTRVPMGASMADGKFGYPFGPKIGARYADQGGLVPQGISAELIADKWGISREDMDALRRPEPAAGRAGHRRGPLRAGDPAGARRRRGDDDGRRGPARDDDGVAGQAQAVVPARGGGRPRHGRQLVADHRRLLGDPDHERGEGRRARPDAAGPLRRLRPRRRRPPPDADGADPGDGQGASSAPGMAIDDIDLVEINEAFASVVLAWEKEFHPDMDKVNVNGGAIALGHPLGCSGARLMTTLLNELERTGGRYGLQTMCEGGGMANATIIERLG